MKLLIKNMVCPRCKMSVRDTLSKAGFQVKSVELGEAIIAEELSDKQLLKLETALVNNGFELIKDRKAELIEKIKNLIVELIYWSDDKAPLLINHSDYLSQKLKREYHYLSGLFSEVESITIEKYYINQRVERAKELITYGELPFNVIAHKLKYASIHHFSNQFKSITGMSPTTFSKLKKKKRIEINKVGKK